MNFDPITPYQIIEGLKKENEYLRKENDRLREELANNDSMDETSDRQVTE